MGFYKVLGISASSTDDEVKRAYRKKIQRHCWHPNKDIRTEEDTKEERLLNKAVDVLLDCDKRAKYNANVGNESSLGLESTCFDAFFAREPKTPE